MYRPVIEARQGAVTARALVGTHSVVVAWDFVGDDVARGALLGFAVQRTPHVAGGRARFLEGQKRFPGQEGLGDNIPSNVAPFQRFRWGDYGAIPGARYTYRIHPVTGTAPDGLVLGDPAVLEIETSPEVADGLGLHVNRGVASALAYRVKYGTPPQNLDEPKRTQAYAWLTRELKPAFLGFVDGAQAGDELRLAIFEFDDADAAAALARATARGVRVRIVYHAMPKPAGQRAETEALLATVAAAPGDLVPRTKVPKLSHDKLAVIVRDGVAVAAWTGSTNLTRAGFYLQTNIGLALTDPALAGAYARYWQILAGDPPRNEARTSTAALVASVREELPVDAPRPFFSPVAGAELLDVAVDLVGNAGDLVLISSPFGLDGRIIDAINGNPETTMEFGLVNVTQGSMIAKLPHAASRFSWFTTPAWMPQYEGRPWDAQPVGNHKIHAKLIVADPFAATPRVLVGSANFSDESVNDNDENALLFEGSSAARVAAVLGTEFLRMFDHYKTRAFIAGLGAAPDDQYLALDGSWTTPYWQAWRIKCRERLVFGGAA